MKIDMDSPDAPWNGSLWLKLTVHTQKTIDSYANSTDQEEVAFSQGLAAGMGACLTALKADWRLKAFERKEKEL